LRSGGRSGWGRTKKWGPFAYIYLSLKVVGKLEVQETH
jgi:hypothetical protein